MRKDKDHEQLKEMFIPTCRKRRISGMESTVKT